MENPEQKIAKALTGLRDCKASPGLEARVLCALEDHAPQPAQSWWSALMPAWMSTLSMANATLACAVLLAGLLSYLLIPHTPEQLSAGAHRRMPVARPTPHSTAVAVAIARPTLKLTRARPHRNSVHSGSRLISFPAPPLPLTEQEKLLLRVARSHRPSQIAPLEPETQLAEAARDKQEFNKFFDQHTQGAPNETN